MAKASLTCCTYHLCLGEGGYMIFSFDKSTSLEGRGQEKNPQMIGEGGGLQENKRKNKEIIIAHPLDKL